MTHTHPRDARHVPGQFFRALKASEHHSLAAEIEAQKRAAAQALLDDGEPIGRLY